MQLYDPQRHLTLAPEPWNAEVARNWLRVWSDSAGAAKVAGMPAWPIHPRDASDDASTLTQAHSLYFGTLGVLLALDRVAAAGLGGMHISTTESLRETHLAYCQSPDTGERVPSWYLGESSLLTALTLQELSAPNPARSAQLAEMIRSNRDNPTREALWGAPSTMLAALILWERTQHVDWQALFVDSVKAIWSSWFQDESTGAWLWEQDMYGRLARYVGAGHGWAGNLYPLWRGQELLTVAQRRLLEERTVQSLEALALVDGGFANWPARAGDERVSLTQWCHGAPGIITALRYANLPGVLPMLCKGGATIVDAGPLVKGVGLCHGTDGNGMALLELFRKTGDEAWLASARQFAMWAIRQSNEAFKTHGQWRYSLWTGDAGLACFLLDCLDGNSRGMPGVDTFFDVDPVTARTQRVHTATQVRS